MIMSITILDGRTKLEKIISVISLAFERDTETQNGYVAEVPGLDRQTALNAVATFERAGFEASWSQDDEGRYFVWVV